MNTNYSKSSELEQFANQGLILLTKREWEVMLLMTDDIPNDVIAQKLFLTTASVKTYRKRIGNKLLLSGRDVLARYARKNREHIRQTFIRLS